MAKKMEAPKPFNPKMGKKELALLSRLCDALAVSGDEQEIRDIVMEELEGHADEMRVDHLGNLLVTKKGKGKDNLRVMVAAHMDEVGFMLIKDEGKGIFEFRTVGGIDPRQLVGKQVIVGREHVPGIIGAKAIHLTTPAERKQALTVNQLRIDLGPGGSSKAKPGDRATFATKLQVMGPTICSKALDNRLGVYNLIQLVKNAPENIDLLAAFTVQEEVGLRGAKVAAFAMNPDIGIAIDSTPALDLPDFDGEDNTLYRTHLDGGPAIYLMDGATIADRRLVDWLVDTAKDENIPWQFRQPAPGGTDAGAIHRVREGVPSVSVSVPGRYAHSAAGMARIDDELNTLRLLHAGLARLDKKILLRQE